MFFLNMEGMSLVSEDEVEAIGTVISMSIRPADSGSIGGAIFSISAHGNSARSQ